VTLTEFEMLAADRDHGDLAFTTFDADQVPPMHTHGWSTLLLVTEGRIALAFEDRTEQLEPGDWCEVGADVLHSEQTGPHGATVALVTRR
jgi:quercetin dioxygenase-like cupin family protein